MTINATTTTTMQTDSDTEESAVTSSESEHEHEFSDDHDDGKRAGRGKRKRTSLGRYEESTDTEPVPSTRGRGRGRGRGVKRGKRKRVQSGTVAEEEVRIDAEEGPSGRQAEAGPSHRGRGGTRGKRKRTGAFQLTEEEIERLEAAQAEKIRRTDEMVDQLSPEGTKAILKEVAKSLPSLVWDVATRLQGEGGGPPIPSSKDPAPIWCVCTNCREMDTDAGRVCCGMRPDLCHINMPEMRLTICEPGALQVQQIYRNDIFARHAATEEDANKAMRHAAYRQYILFHYGRLGHGVRRPVPSCCTWYIRDRFPDPNHSYVGYVPSW